MSIISIASRYGEDDRILSEDTAECLRKWLKMAEDGEIISVAIAGEMQNGDVVTGRSTASRRYCVIGALDTLKHEIIQSNLGDVE